MEDIASNKFENIFWAPTNKDLENMPPALYNHVCNILPIQHDHYIEPKKIIDQTTYEAASKYKNKLNALPSWMPNFNMFKKGNIPYFTYDREN